MDIQNINVHIEHIYIKYMCSLEHIYIKYKYIYKNVGIECVKHYLTKTEEIPCRMEWNTLPCTRKSKAEVRWHRAFFWTNSRQAQLITRTLD